MKIGLVGEAPTDTQSIENVLSKKWGEEHTYVTLLQNITGSLLDEQKTKQLLRRQFQWETPDVVVFIRDLDGLSGEREKQLIRKTYFRENNTIVQDKGVFLLCVYEIEALLLSDLDGLNQFLETTMELTTDPHQIENPKELIKAHANNYYEGLNPSIFETLSFEKLLDHPSFAQFVEDFNTKLTA